MWYTNGMNELVREKVKQAMAARGMSQSELSRVLDIPRPNINRALVGRSGEVPKLWQNILETLDLELTAVPRTGEHG